MQGKLKINDYVLNINSIGTKEERIQEIVELMKANMSNPIEVYTPPASDIGGSCGQFLLDYYKEYNLQIV